MTRYSGFIAQEVEEAANAVGYDFSGIDSPKGDDDIYGLRYAEFVTPLVKAIQELEQKIEEQELTFEQQEKVIKDYEQAFAELNARLTRLQGTSQVD